MTKVAYHVLKVFIMTMTILTSLAFYRASMQQDYHWGLLIIDGTGKSGDYLNIMLLFLLSWLCYGFLNFYRKPWYPILPIVLTSLSLYATCSEYFSDKSRLVFNGDALNIHLNMGVLMVVITILAFLSAIYFTYTTINKPVVIPHIEKKAKVMFGLVIILSIVILIEFSFGDGQNHISSDRIAVILTILQAFFFYYISMRYGRSV